jgi:antitoxin (DNA-binding transcriptional repressor) of toxin-antitoxin stability system
MQQFSVDEAKAHLPELLDAALRGEEVVIAQDSNHLIRLVPTQIVKGPRIIGGAKGTFTVSDDFDEPLADFEEYMP